MCQKVKKASKNDGGISKGYRSQMEAILIDQIWDNLSFKTMIIMMVMVVTY